MVKTLYVSLNELTDTQIDIMQFVDLWVHTKKTTVPFKEISIEMTKRGVPHKTIEYSIKILMSKGYLRRSVGGGNGKASFVQLRRV